MRPKVHNTDPTKDNESRSHATGPSKVPEGIQKIAPEGLERALPESIHPTKVSIHSNTMSRSNIADVSVMKTSLEVGFE